MELLVEAGVVPQDQVSALEKEGNELVAMTVASIKTLRNSEARCQHTGRSFDVRNPECSPVSRDRVRCEAAATVHPRHDAESKIQNLKSKIDATLPSCRTRDYSGLNGVPTHLQHRAPGAF